MRFVVDGNLPPRLALLLVGRGHEAWHVFELGDELVAHDVEIARWADAQGGVVISKDADFDAPQITRRSPRRLIMVEVGNMGTSRLLALFDRRIEELALLLRTSRPVELHDCVLVSHRDPGRTMTDAGASARHLRARFGAPSQRRRLEQRGLNP